MIKIFISFLLAFFPFYANAITIHHSSDSKIISSEELHDVIYKNMDNFAIKDLGDNYRINAKAGSIINQDGSVIYLVAIIFQKKIKDAQPEIKDIQSGNIFFWVDKSRYFIYGQVSTKQQLLDRIKRTVIDEVNQWRP